MQPKRILVVTPVPLEPLAAGNRARIRRMIDDLRARGHELHLALIPDKPGDLDAMRVWMEGRFHVLPNPRPPFRNPLRFRLLNGVTFGHAMGERFQYLSDVDDFVSETLERGFSRVVRELAPDVAIVSYPFYSRLLELLGPRTVGVLDTHDRFTRRHWQQWRHRLRTRFASMSARQEKRALDRADVVLAIQEEEGRHFRRLTDRPVLTLGHRVGLQRLPPREADGPPRIGLVGADNGSNVRGTNWFVARVLPSLRRRFPGLELHLAGTLCDCPGLKPGPGVRLHGVIDDVAKFYEDIDVVLNPAFAGTGLHIKNVEAMGFARPIVMSTGATRGIREVAGRAYRTARTARGFHREIARLLEDREHAARVADEAWRFAARYEARVERQLDALLEH